MQINSTTNLNTQYITDLQNKQATASSSFEDELTSQNEETSEITTSGVSAIAEPQERYYNVYTYANTKGMTSDDIDEYFQDKTEEERNHIKSVVATANSFSEDDLANEAVFNEFKNYTNVGNGKELISTNFFTEKSNFSKGLIGLSNTFEISGQYLAAKQAGIQNPQAQGIYMNEADKARHESGDFSIIGVTFTSEEATDFLSTMTQLAKDKMEQSAGTQVYDDYKEAYERYSRMNDNYNELVAKEEANTKMSIQA